MKTLDEILEENEGLAAKVRQLESQLSEATKHASADLPALQSKLAAEEAKAKELQGKLDAANKELTELRAKALDVDKRAAAMVKAMGIATDGFSETEAAQQPQAGESHSPGTWQAEAEKRFQK